MTKRLVAASTWPLAQVGELINLNRAEPVGLMKVGLDMLDRATYAVIEQRRRAADLEGRRDILSLLLQARTESGEEMSDKELRDELLTLVLAGHETTANSLAWTWERLVRTPSAHERAARRGPLRRGRRRADRGDDRRGDALAAGDSADRPAGQGAVAAR